MFIPSFLSSLDAIWGRCSLVISPWGSDSEAFHSVEKKGIIPGGVFGIHQMATTGNVELTTCRLSWCHWGHVSTILRPKH